jgi:biotin carboxyl carrier protein
VQYDVEVNGRVRQVAVHRQPGRFVVIVDGRSWTLDAARIGARTWSLLVTEETSVPSDRTSSYETHVSPDAGTGLLIVHVGPVAVPVLLNGRRRSGRKEEGAAGARPERLVAPMPGKIVRVLVKPGDAVRARQPMVVIEAMKMENELRAGCDGIVAELPVADGQSVDAGALVAVIARP